MSSHGTRRILIVVLVLVAVVGVGGLLLLREDEQTVSEQFCGAAEQRHDADPDETRDLDVDLAVEEAAAVPGAVGMAQAADGSYFVVARLGQLWHAPPDGPAREVLDLGDELDVESLEQGLLGVAVAPDQAHLYLYGTFAVAKNQIIELPLVDGEVDPTGRRDVLVLDDPASTHNGGRLAFGPDGLLYLGIGDGGDGALSGAAQDLGSPFGKLLRIEPTPSNPDPYEIPADNPFVGVDGAREEVWALGFRNPWGWSIDAATGDLWVGDVGQICAEEVNLAAGDGGRGANFGWSFEEGAHEFLGPALGKGGSPDLAVELPDLGPPPEDLRGPLIEYPRSEQSCSVIGGFVYRGAALPDLVGTYVHTDLCGQRLRTLTPAGDGWAAGTLDVTLPSGVVAFGEGIDGELYVVSIDSGIYALTPAA